MCKWRVHVRSILCACSLLPCEFVVFYLSFFVSIRVNSLFFYLGFLFRIRVGHVISVSYWGLGFCNTHLITMTDSLSESADNSADSAN